MRVCIIYFFFIAATAYGQETKFVEKTEGQFGEEYYVLKSDKKVRHGTYVKYHRSILGTVALEESGAYEMGARHGEWTFFVRNSFKGYSISSKGNYFHGEKNGLWTYYHIDSIPRNAKVSIFDNPRRKDSVQLDVLTPANIRMVGLFVSGKRVGQWTTLDRDGVIIQRYNFTHDTLLVESSLKDSMRLNFEHPVLFVGGPENLSREISELLNGNKLFLGTPPDSAAVLVSVPVDNKGEPGIPVIVQSNGRRIFEEGALRIMASIRGGWIPARKNGRPADSNYVVKFLIKSKPTSDQFRVVEIKIESMTGSDDLNSNLVDQ
jgi:antitoxin component YwqK of YwqJK toxin-antitoxin module